MNPHPKPVRKKKGKPRRRKITTLRRLELRAEKLIREIVWWRDGGQCVLKGLDGGRCGGPLQWGHFITRHNSPWLKLTLFTFVQCRNHNMLHDRRDPVFGEWVAATFGLQTITALRTLQELCKGRKPDEAELRERIAVFEELLAERPTVWTFGYLVKIGYYGREVRNV